MGFGLLVPREAAVQVPPTPAGQQRPLSPPKNSVRRCSGSPSSLRVRLSQPVSEKREEGRSHTLWAPAVPCVLVALVTGLPEDTNDHLHLGDGKPRLCLMTNKQVVELGLEITTWGTRKRGHSVTVTVVSPLPSTA